MKYFGKVVNKTNKEIAVFLSGHPTVKGSIILQSGEESELYPIADEELAEKLLKSGIGQKIPSENSYFLLIVIQHK